MFTASATPVDLLTDGQTVNVNVKANPGYNVYQGFVEECRAGVTYQPSTGIQYNADARPNGPNCPLAPVSSSANPGVSDTNMINSSASPEGDTIPIRVGIGNPSWKDSAGVTRSVLCDPTHPCALVTELFAGPKDGSTPPLWVPFVQQITFADSNPLATCGGAANGALSTSGSDSMLDAWTKWTLDLCKRPGQKGAATKASFIGEGPAVQQFDAGALDLAYTAAGRDPDVGLDTSGTKRPSVAVPIASGAEAVGVGNGYGSGGKKVPFPSIKVTPDEMAALVASGQFTPTDVQASMTARNPDLSPFFFAQTPTMQVGVPSGTSSSTWFLSRYLATAAPDSWKVPPIGAAGPDAGKPRGIFNDFGTVQPDFTLLTTYTGRPALRQALFSIESNNFLLGGVYVVSDLTTSIAEGLVPMAIQNQPGGPFVSPDQASMDAAVADMTPDVNGLLQPAAHPSDPAAYPLTYVVYALVPAQPLVDLACTPRPSSQALLTSWLDYLTGPGQSALDRRTGAAHPRSGRSGQGGHRQDRDDAQHLQAAAEAGRTGSDPHHGATERECRHRATVQSELRQRLAVRRLGPVLRSGERTEPGQGRREDDRRERAHPALSRQPVGQRVGHRARADRDHRARLVGRAVQLGRPGSRRSR